MQQKLGLARTIAEGLLPVWRSEILPLVNLMHVLGGMRGIPRAGVEKGGEG